MADGKRVASNAHFEHNTSGRHSPPKHTAPQNNRGGKKKKKKGMRGWQKAIIIILAVLLALIVGAFALVSGKLGRIGQIELIDKAEWTDVSEESFDEDTEEADSIAEEEIEFSNTDEILSDKDVVNIMLVGRDARSASERGRSDSMILLSMNRKTQQISMVSLMRDVYTQIPGYSNNKMNAAFAFGGYELMDTVIEQNYGISIDYNVGVNFEGLTQVVDQLGGIDLYLTAAEAKYLNGSFFQNNVSGLTEGINHLNGEAVLSYSRIRYVSTGSEANDFGRTYRQRMVLTTIYKEMMKHSWTEIWTLLDSIMDCLETDMTQTEMMSLGLEAYNMGLDSIQSYRLPCDGEYRDETINRMMVLVIDWDAARKHLQDWLYSDTPLADNSLTTVN